MRLQIYGTKSWERKLGGKYLFKKVFIFNSKKRKKGRKKGFALEIHWERKCKRDKEKKKKKKNSKNSILMAVLSAVGGIKNATSTMTQGNFSILFSFLSSF